MALVIVGGLCRTNGAKSDESGRNGHDGQHGKPGSITEESRPSAPLSDWPMPSPPGSSFEPCRAATESH